jgi:hypothetical protein
LTFYEPLKPRRLTIFHHAPHHPRERVDLFQPIASVPAGGEAVVPQGDKM